jgi:raffinose/stachyose/melibiose transport system permease protein
MPRSMSQIASTGTRLAGRARRPALTEPEEAVAADAGREPRARRRSLKKVPWLIAIPAVAVLIGLRFLPSIIGGTYAFTSWNGAGTDATWIGLENFRTILSDPTTSNALVHTFQLAGLLVVICNVLGLLLALGLRKQLKTRNLMRALFFLPFALSHLATGYIWQYIFQYSGPLNSLLAAVGLESWQRVWLADPTFAIYTILVVLVWQYTGLTMVIYLAGLEGIPDELHDAAAVDGASPWLKFRKVTLPLLAPAITISVTLTLIFGLGAFDQVLSMTGGGPVNATQTLATQVWQNTFVYGRFGYGSALALILTALVAVLSIAQVSLLRYREARL